MRTLIDPFELQTTTLPPARPPMATISVEVDFESEERTPSYDLVPIPDSWSRVRCWCSED